MGTKNKRQKKREKMQQKDSVEELKNGIRDIWEKTRNNIETNIIRGHSRSISTDVEDMIALFISKEFDNKVKIFIDPSITISSKTYRPDVLVIRNGKVIALVEIKANMGWCRDASSVIDEELVIRQKVFSTAGQIECKFSITKTSETISYDDNVKLYLIALTSENGGKLEAENKAYAKKHGVNHYILFDGWYDNLEPREIDDFIKDLETIK